MNEAIDEYNQQPELKKLAKEPDTLLMDEGSELDSLGLVNLIVSIEEKLEEQLNLDITFADERALTQEISPFKSIANLRDYINNLASEELNGN